MMNEELSILLPYRPDNDLRDQIFRWVYARFELLFPGAQICVASDGAELGHPHFSRAVACNRAAAMAKGSVFLIGDGDVLAFPQAIAAGMEMLKDPGIGWVLPYNLYIRLDEEISSYLLAGLPVVDPVTLGHLGLVQMSVNSTSSLALVTRRNFEAVGGFDERFVGWAPEDQAWAAAVTTLCGPVRRVMTHDLYHIWHPFPIGHDERKGSIHEKDNLWLWGRYQQANGNPGLMKKLVGEQCRT